MSSTKDSDSSGKLRRVEAQSWVEENRRNDYPEDSARDGNQDVDERIVWDEV